MRQTRSGVRAIIWFVLLPSLAIHAASLRAQATLESAQREPPERVWVSLGLGAGTGATLAGVTGGWYSRGSFAIGAQYSVVQPFWSADEHSSVALLAGARTGGNRAFLVGAVGLAAARFITDCNSACQLHEVGHDAVALAFSAQAVANARIPGLTLGTFGALGPRRVSYAGVALSLALGWFGE